MSIALLSIYSCTASSCRCIFERRTVKRRPRRPYRPQDAVHTGQAGFYRVFFYEYEFPVRRILAGGGLERKLDQVQHQDIVDRIRSEAVERQLCLYRHLDWHGEWCGVWDRCSVGGLRHRVMSLELYDGTSGDLAVRQSVTCFVDLVQGVASRHQAIQGQPALPKPAHEQGQVPVRPAGPARRATKILTIRTDEVHGEKKKTYC